MWIEDASTAMPREVIPDTSTMSSPYSSYGNSAAPPLSVGSAELQHSLLKQATSVGVGQFRREVAWSTSQPQDSAQPGLSPKEQEPIGRFAPNKCSDGCRIFFLSRVTEDLSAAEAVPLAEGPVRMSAVRLGASPEAWQQLRAAHCKASLSVHSVSPASSSPPRRDWHPHSTAQATWWMQGAHFRPPPRSRHNRCPSSSKAQSSTNRAATRRHRKIVLPRIGTEAIGDIAMSQPK
mmetsp:Transcript_3370/g.7745  ORF Transcript_3370/g.7745 Transcript_3370/m.7745 type:complete len:235 (-) Transcript_3370:8-712(-)